MNTLNRLTRLTGSWRLRQSAPLIKALLVPRALARVCDHLLGGFAAESLLSTTVIEWTIGLASLYFLLNHRPMDTKGDN